MQIHILQFFRKAKKKSYGSFDSGKHSVHWGMNPPLKNTPPHTFLPRPPLLHCKSANCPSPTPHPLFRQSHSLYWFFVSPLLKVAFFSEPPKYQSFSSLTQSYLLKVTNFLLKISQFEFLAITEKNTFAYKLFLSLNISDFNTFYVKTATPLPPLKKATSLFPSNSPIKVEALSSSLPFFEN